MDNSKITILYVEENQNGTTGGSHVCLLDLVSELNKEHFKPIVMFYEDNRLVDDFKKAGAKVFIFRKPLPISFLKRLRAAKSYHWKVLYFLLRIFQSAYNWISTSIIPLIYFIIFIYKYNIQIVHLNNSVFVGLEWVIASKVTGRKVIAHQRTHLSSTFSPYLKYHHRWFDYIFGMSNYTKEYLRECGVNLVNYSTFYDRIDLRNFRASLNRDAFEVRRELGISVNQPVIGIVGNLQRWKGQMTVVEAIHILKEKYPDLQCLIIGDLSNRTSDDIKYHNDLVTKIGEYGLGGRVKLTGHRSDIANLLNAIDIFIHASIDPEPFGLVVLEAMSMGKAIIASNEGGPVEMLEDGVSGLLIQPGQPHILAEKIDFFLSNPGLMKKMGQDAQQRMEEKFSTIDIAYIENVYHRLLEQ